MPENDHALLHLKIYAPREPEPRPFNFPRTETVGEAARHVAEAFGYAAGTPSFQNGEGEVLERTRSLVAEHVHDGATLELVDVGGGV